MKNDASTQKSPQMKHKNSGGSALFNLLEIPAELACVYSKLDGNNSNDTLNNITNIKFFYFVFF